MRTFLVGLALALLMAGPADAHHEAIFGPQSSAVLSPRVFLSAQMFVRENGQDDDKRRETTAVFSTGLSPFKRPLSFAIVVPFRRTCTVPQYEQLATTSEICFAITPVRVMTAP